MEEIIKQIIMTQAEKIDILLIGKTLIEIILFFIV